MIINLSNNLNIIIFSITIFIALNQLKYFIFFNYYQDMSNLSKL